MRKLADIENSDLYMDYKYAYEHIITFGDFTENSSYSVFDMFTNAILDGFSIEIHNCEDNLLVVVKKKEFSNNYVVDNISDKQAMIIDLYNHIKSAIEEIKKKIDKERSNE